MARTANSIGVRCAALIVTALLLVAPQCRSSDEGPAGPAVLDISVRGEPATLDPVLATDESAINVLGQLFVGLTRYDTESRRAVPGLASEWDVSEDGRTYTFELRDDVYWVDSTGVEVGPVTAADVVYSVRRVCDRESAAPFAETLFLIEDCEAAYTATGIVDLEGVGVRAVDEHTVEFTLQEAAAYFPILLSTWVARPQPSDLVQTHGSDWFAPETILVNGPYVLREWTAGERIVLQKNPQYYDSDSVQIDRIDVRLDTDSATARTLYDAGELDTITLSPADVERLETPEEGNDVHVRAPVPCTTVYGFTNAKPPLDGREVRLALSQAIPRDRIVTDVLRSAALPAHHFAPPGIFGAPPADTVGVFSNRTRARELLASAGYPDGQGFPSITLMHVAGDADAAVATTVAEAWRETLGIDVQVIAEDETTLQKKIYETTPLDEMPHVWQLSWCASSLDQHMWLYEAFHCSGSTNPLRRLCGTFDMLVEQAAVEGDPEEREELYVQAEELLAREEAGYAPLYHHAVDVVTKPWLRRNYPILGGWDVDNWHLDTAQKLNATVATQEPTSGGTRRGIVGK